MKRPIISLLMLLPLFLSAQNVAPSADPFADQSAWNLNQDLPETNALWQEAATPDQTDTQPGYLSLITPEPPALKIFSAVGQPPVFSTPSLDEPFLSLPPGTYQLRYQWPGHPTQQRQVTLRAGQITRLVCP